MQFGLSRVEGVTDAGKLGNQFREARGCLCCAVFSAKSNPKRHLHRHEDSRIKACVGESFIKKKCGTLTASYGRNMQILVLTR